MADYIFLMHDDVRLKPSPESWTAYLSELRDRGVLTGEVPLARGLHFAKKVLAVGTALTSRVTSAFEPRTSSKRAIPRRESESLKPAALLKS